MPTTSTPRPWQRLHVNLLVGALLGLVYTGVDAYLDRLIGTQVSAPPRPVELFHAVIDLVLPTITGALMGLATHYVQLRAHMAETEKRRADALSLDLHKIERDQAVWVISASLLHELKNPLHALGLLLDEALDLPEGEHEQRRTLLQRARKQTERIAQQLVNLRGLPASRRPELPCISLQEQVQATLEELHPRVARVGVQIRLAEATATAFANPAYLRVILENLIDNALDALAPAGDARETPVQVPPALEIQIEHRSGQSWLDIRDNGPGITEEERARVFEPLRTTKSSGLGLGLAIARALARSMGGDLRLLDSQRGTCFRLLLEAPKT